MHDVFISWVVFQRVKMHIASFNSVVEHLDLKVDVSRRNTFGPLINQAVVEVTKRVLSQVHWRSVVVYRWLRRNWIFGHV